MIDVGTYSEAQQGDQQVARYDGNFTRDELWSVILKLESTVGGSQVFEFIDAETLPAEVPIDQAADNADQHCDVAPLAAPKDASLTQSAAVVSPFCAVVIHRWKKNQNRSVSMNDDGQGQPLL
jgi:hypothetical protein